MTVRSLCFGTVLGEVTCEVIKSKGPVAFITFGLQVTHLLRAGSPAYRAYIYPTRAFDIYSDGASLCSFHFKVSDPAGGYWLYSESVVPATARSPRPGPGQAGCFLHGRPGMPVNYIATHIEASYGPGV